MAVDFSGDTLMVDEEVDNTQDMASSPASSSTERGSSAEITAPNLLELLRGVSMVLLYIQQNWAAGSREGNVVTVLRGTPEIGAQILGSYLEALQVLVQCGLELGEKLTSAVVNVWRSCIWGNPNSKKVHDSDIPVPWLLDKKFTPPIANGFSCRYCFQTAVSCLQLESFQHHILRHGSETKWNN